MLTREEIQSVITKVNLLMALERVEECARKGDLQNLQFALMSRYIGLKSSVKTSKLDAYSKKLLKLMTTSPDAYLKPEDIERCITEVNKMVWILETFAVISKMGYYLENNYS